MAKATFDTQLLAEQAQADMHNRWAQEMRNAGYNEDAQGIIPKDDQGNDTPSATRTERWSLPVVDDEDPTKYAFELPTARHPGWSYVPLVGDVIAATMSGTTNGAAVIGDHASIGVGPVGGVTFTAYRWGATQGGTEYGTGSSPTDYTAGDEGQLYVEADGDDGNTYAASALIRHPFASNTGGVISLNFNRGTPVVTPIPNPQGNLTMSIVLGGDFGASSFDAQASELTYLFNAAGSGSMTQTSVDQYGYSYTPLTVNYTVTATAPGDALDVYLIQDTLIDPAIDLVQNWTFFEDGTMTLIGNLPAGLTFTGGTNSATLTGTPTEDATELDITLRHTTAGGNETDGLVNLFVTTEVIATPYSGRLSETDGIPGESVLELDASWNGGGDELTVDWAGMSSLPDRTMEVYSRTLGQTSQSTWNLLASGLSQTPTTYVDTTVAANTAVEYQVFRKSSAGTITDAGYWLAGQEIAADTSRGQVLLVIETGLVTPLADEIERLERDLVGDGWVVEKFTAARNTASAETNLTNALAVKDWIQSEIAASPFDASEHSILLLGHVPIVKSGSVNPDGHESRAHPTDLFYADTSGYVWPTVDGGFDLEPDLVPDLVIETPIGRVDFESVTRSDPPLEQRMLKRYLDRNHNFRHLYAPVPSKAYGDNGSLEFERAALRNLVGPANIVTGQHDPTGISEPHLFGFDFGSFDGSTYVDAGMKTVFGINFGSYKQEFTLGLNEMVGLLGNEFYPLAVGWGGRPNWVMQHMALGGTIGDAHLRTVNNGPLLTSDYENEVDYLTSSLRAYRSPIWVNLMGDPTLTAYPMEPVNTLVCFFIPDNGTFPDRNGLFWGNPTDPDFVGCQVFRADGPGLPFTALSGILAPGVNNYADNNPPADVVYMVRAYALRQVHAGSFYTYSQGVFASVAVAQAPAMTARTIATSVNTPVTIPALAGGIWSIATAPAASEGTLVHDGTDWVFTPETGFTGSVVIKEALTGALQTAVKDLTITVS